MTTNLTEPDSLGLSGLVNINSGDAGSDDDPIVDPEKKTESTSPLPKLDALVPPYLPLNYSIIPRYTKGGVYFRDKDSNVIYFDPLLNPFYI